jgi:hypothetical protein
MPLVASTVSCRFRMDKATLLEPFVPPCLAELIATCFYDSQAKTGTVWLIAVVGMGLEFC